LYHVASSLGHRQRVGWANGPMGSLASHCFWEISAPFRKGKNASERGSIQRLDLSPNGNTQPDCSQLNHPKSIVN
jgi:hypothetical protein